MLYTQTCIYTDIFCIPSWILGPLKESDPSPIICRMLSSSYLGPN